MARSPYDVLAETHIAIVKQFAEAIALNDILTEQNQRLGQEVLKYKNAVISDRTTFGAPSLLSIPKLEIQESDSKPSISTESIETSRDEARTAEVRTLREAI